MAALKVLVVVGALLIVIWISPKTGMLVCPPGGLLCLEGFTPTPVVTNMIQLVNQPISRNPTGR